MQKYTLEQISKLHRSMYFRLLSVQICRFYKNIETRERSIKHKCISCYYNIFLNALIRGICCVNIRVKIKVACFLEI